jgi:hypothetical protein
MKSGLVGERIVDNNSALSSPIGAGIPVLHRLKPVSESLLDNRKTALDVNVKHRPETE